MIRKYVFGKPFVTGAVVKSIKPEIEEIEFLKKSGNELSFQLGRDDIVYGLGQMTRGINKRGWHYSCYNLDNCNHQEDSVSLYGSHNFLIVSGKSCFGIFIDFPGRIDYDIGYKDSSQMKIAVCGDDYDIYIITEKNEREIVKELRRLTGKSYVAPKWGFGYCQSRWGYKSEEDIRAVAENHQKNDIPLDSICMDIDYMEDYKDFTVDKNAFPDLKSLASDMAAEGIHLVPIIDAGVKIESGYEVYEEGVKNNYLCKDKNGKDFTAAVWPGKVHFPDFLQKEAREWFGSKYKPLIEAGIDGFWNDMNEPAIFYTEKRLNSVMNRIGELSEKNMGINEYFEFTGLVNSISHNSGDYEEFFHNAEGVAVSHKDVHNLYGFNMTRAASEAFEKISPDKKMLIYSRSSYIGMHRYGGMWQGDNRSWWSHLLMNIQMTASLNMAGFLYTGADTGGFGSDTTEDLMVRWLQFSVFTPLMRNHSAIGTREQEVYKFANMEDCRRIIKLRYVLLPYLYDTYLKAAEEDDMMFRPLGFDYHDERSRHTEDQLLLGDEVMIAPVYVQNAVGKNVYLPEEMMLVRMKSANEYTTEILSAGDYFVKMPTDELTFFIRKGKSIRVCEGGKNTAELLDKLFRIGYLK